MKKVLLFAFIALAMNGFAQSKIPASRPVEINQGKDHTGRNSYNIQPEQFTGNDIKHQMSGQSLFIQLFDSIYHWHIDSPDTALKADYKFIHFVYDKNNNQTGFVYQLWRDNLGGWENSYQEIHTYDVSNNHTSLHSNIWNDNEWENDFRYIYSYDANNNKINYLSQDWHIDKWVNDDQVIYTYDANNILVNELSQFWSDSDTIWVIMDQYIYTYDTNKNLTTKTR